MDRSVEVVVSELHLAAARLQDAGQRLQDGLSSVDLQTRELLGSGWKGEAASAFGQEWEKWHSGAGQVVRGLQTMSDLLTVAGKEYAKTDEQAAGAVASSFQGTGGSNGIAAGNSPGSAVAGSSPGGAGGANDMAQLMNLTQPVSQMGGHVAQGLAQAGQVAAGLAQAAAGIAQQAEHEDTRHDQRPGDAAAAGDASAPTAPVDTDKPTGGSRQSAE
jgi:WXG100 family type VII secretion target